MNGYINAANEWLEKYAENSHNHMPFYKIRRHFTTARAHIVAGDFDRVILFLKKLLLLAESYRRSLDIIESLILLAIVNCKNGWGGLNTALDYLERAAKCAYEYKYTQIFANNGAELTTLLQRLQKRSQQASYQWGAPSGFIKALYIAAFAGSKHFKGMTSERTPETIKFTYKQKAVMNLMCEGYSRNEIVAKLEVKPDGVKSHITLIYNKLDVANSIEAVLKIKELGLLNGYVYSKNI